MRVLDKLLGDFNGRVSLVYCGDIEEGFLVFGRRMVKGEFLEEV